jgi:hypothetical protein
MPRIPNKRVAAKTATVPKICLAILAGSGIALVVAQVLGLFLHS